MHRRSFLASVAAAGVSRQLLGSERRRRSTLSSDFDALGRVLVHSPGPETDQAGTERGERDGPGPVVRNPPLTAEGRGQHADFVAHLARNRAQVVFLKDSLDEAIARCEKAGRFQGWLEREVPSLAGENAGEITSSTLIGAVPRFLDIPNEEGIPRPAVPPLADVLRPRHRGDDSQGHGPRQAGGEFSRARAGGSWASHCDGLPP